MRSRHWLLLALIVSASGLSALEIGVEARSGSLQFPWSDTTALAGTGNFDATDPTRWFWGGAGWADIPLGEDFDFHLGYETDPVLRNVVSSLFRFDRGIARIGVGPFFGFLNQDNRLASFGLSTAIQVQWPGIAFLSARSDGGLALGLVAGLASVPQTRAEISAGFFTPNAIVSAVVSGKRFSQTDAANKLINDDLTSYSLVVDIYKKNVPYRITTTVGYQIRSKFFEGSGTSGLTDSLGSAVMGLKLSVEAVQGLIIYGEFSDAVFTFGMDNLKGRSPPTSSVLFQASLGTTWLIDTDELVAGVQRMFEKKKPAANPAPAKAP